MCFVNKDVATREQLVAELGPYDGAPANPVSKITMPEYVALVDGGGSVDDSIQAVSINLYDYNVDTGGTTQT